VNSFEENLSAALTDAEALAAVDPEGGRAVFQTFVQGRQRRRRIAVAARLTVVTLIAAVGGATVAVRVVNAPINSDTPAVTPHDQGQGNLIPDEARGSRPCYPNRYEGGCRIIG